MDNLVEEVTAYKTSDGKLWTSKEKAEVQQAELNFEAEFNSLLAESGYKDRVSIEFIRLYRVKLHKILDDYINAIDQSVSN